MYVYDRYICIFRFPYGYINVFICSAVVLKKTFIINKWTQTQYTLYLFSFEQ